MTETTEEVSTTPKGRRAPRARPTPAGAATITATRAQWDDALKRIVPVTQSPTTMPVLNCVRLRAIGGGVLLTATDLDTWVSVPLELAELSGTGAELFDACVPAKRLADTIALLTHEVVSVSAEPGAVVIVGGRARVRLSTLDVAEFPAQRSGFSDTGDAGEADQSDWSVDVGELLGAFARVGYAVLKKAIGQALEGVLWELLADEWRAVGCDRHQFALVRMPLDPARGLTVGGGRETPESEAMILPAAAIGLIKRVLGDAGRVEATWAGRNLRLVAGAGASRTSLTLRLFEGPYPNYRQIMPTGGTSVVVDRDALAFAMQRACVVVETQDTAKVILEFDNGQLTVRGMDTERGDTVEVLEAEYQGPTLRIALNGRYVVNALKPHRSARVQLLILTPEKAVRFYGIADTGAVDESLMTLVMPVRIAD